MSNINECFSELVNETAANEESELSQSVSAVLQQELQQGNKKDANRNNENIETMHGNGILNEKLQKVCRCCLAQDCELKAIFHGNDCTIATMINSLLNSEISPDDGLPGNVCLECLDFLLNCINFKYQLQTADATLRYYIEEGFKHGMELMKVSFGQFAEQIIEELKEGDFENTETMKNLTKSPQELSPLLSLTTVSNPIENVNDGNDNDAMNIEIGPDENISGIEDEFIFDETEMIDQCGFVNDIIEEEIHSKEIEENVEKEEGNNDQEFENLKEILLYDNFDEDDDGSNSEGDNTLNTTKKDISLTIEEKLVCEKCNKSFDDRKIYTRHIESHSKLFFCDNCKQSFRYRSAFHKHKKCHNQEKDNSTVNCDDTKTIKKNFTCEICNAKFSLEDDLHVHGSLHDFKDKFICRRCGKQFSALVKLKRHIPTHFEDKPFKCEVCDMGFAEFGALTRHFRKHTNEKIKKFKCKFCDKKYYDSYSLTIHTRTHTGEKPWVCDKCDKRYTDVRLLNSHMKVHSNEKAFECEMCKKKFTHGSTLNVHMRLHTGEKPYVCGVCNKTFTQTSHLSLHMRTHTGEKPYKCDICDMSFCGPSTLTTHRQTHNKLLDRCSLCDKLISRRHFNIHMRIHLDEKPYECKECSKKFRTSGQLSQHKKTHLKKRKQTNEHKEKYDEVPSNQEHKEKSKEKIDDNSDDSDAIYRESEMLVDNLLATVSGTVINTSCNNNRSSSGNNVSKGYVTISELTDELNNSNSENNVDCNSVQTLDPKD